MKIKSENIIQSKLFSEICQPKKITDISKLQSYLIYHTYNLSKPGQGHWKTTRMLSLYNKNDLNCENHINIKFPINSAVYDVDSHSLFLATGQYDGGSFYNGALLKWELTDNKVFKVVIDNIEFRNIELSNDDIFVDVLPVNDHIDDQTIKRFQIPKQALESHLEDYDYITIDATSEDNHVLDTTRNIEAISNSFNKLGQTHEPDFSHKYSANCVKILNENKIAIGYNDSEIGILNTQNLIEQTIKIEEEANCYQIIPFSKDELLFNFFTIWPSNNFTFHLKRNGSFVQIQNIKGLIYGGHKNYFVKQIERHPFDKKLKDAHLNEKLETLNQIRIGDYNGYQHHLNVYSDSAFYFFQGIGYDDYTYSKNLVEYSVETLELSCLYEFKENEKIVNTNGVIIDNNLFISCTDILKSRSNHLLKFNFDKKTLNQICELDSQIIQLRAIGRHTILFLDIEGKIGIIDLSDLKITYLNEELKVKNQTPICFDLKDSTLVIGYNTGTIEILRIE